MSRDRRRTYMIRVLSLRILLDQLPLVEDFEGGGIRYLDLVQAPPKFKRVLIDAFNGFVVCDLSGCHS